MLVALPILVGHVRTAAAVNFCEERALVKKKTIAPFFRSLGKDEDVFFTKIRLLFQILRNDRTYR